MVIAPK